MRGNDKASAECAPYTPTSVGFVYGILVEELGRFDDDDVVVDDDGLDSDLGGGGGMEHRREWRVRFAAGMVRLQIEHVAVGCAGRASVEGWGG